MKKLLLIAALFLSATCVAQSRDGGYNFDRFDSELPELLERDALTVLLRGVTIELGGQVCKRQSGDVASKAEAAVGHWKSRNEKYTKAAGTVINGFADRIEAARGIEARKSYVNQALGTVSRDGERRVASQFSGPSPSNTLVPSVDACDNFAAYINAGRADIEGNPEITVALRQYMAKQAAR